MGKTIVEAQETKGYGKQVVERLAKDLQKEFAGAAGFSPQNIWFMRDFSLAWPAPPQKLSQAVRESKNRNSLTACERIGCICSAGARCVAPGSLLLRQVMRASEMPAPGILPNKLTRRICRIGRLAVEVREKLFKSGKIRHHPRSFRGKDFV
jgi:hypothetical protein